MNCVMFVGYLGAKPEVKVTRDQTNVASFNVAVEERQGKEKNTIWFRVSAFGKLADICTQYLNKGSHVYVQGTFKHAPNVFQKRDGTYATALEILADKVHFLDSKSDATTPAQPPSSAPRRLDDDDEDIPF